MKILMLASLGAGLLLGQAPQIPDTRTLQTTRIDTNAVVTSLYNLIPLSTATLTESGNLYFTNARTLSAMAGLYEVPVSFSAPLSRSANTISLLLWGSGARPVGASALGVSGNCMQWGAAGAADAGAPCGSGSGGGTMTVVGGGTLTSTALVTGGGAQAAQTPSATAILDTGGNLSLPGSVTATSVIMPSGTPVEVVGACQSPASVATPAPNEYALFLDSTNTCTLSRMNNARSVTVIGTAGGGATAYTQTFTSQTTVALTHNFGLSPIAAFIVQCRDGSGVGVEYGSAVPTDLNTVTVVFAVAQTGSCTVI